MRALPLTVPQSLECIRCSLTSLATAMLAIPHHMCAAAVDPVEGLTCVAILPADPTKIPCLEHLHRGQACA